MGQTAELRTSLSGSDTRVLAISGEIDLGNSGEFAGALLEAVNSREDTVLLLDLSGVTFFGVSGLSVLVEVNDLAQTRDRAFVLGDYSPSVRRVLDLTGTRSRFAATSVSTDVGS